MLDFLNDPTGGRVAYVSAVSEAGGQLFIGNLVKDYVSVLDLAGAGAGAGGGGRARATDPSFQAGDPPGAGDEDCCCLGRPLLVPSFHGFDLRALGREAGCHVMDDALRFGG